MRATTVIIGNVGSDEIDGGDGKDVHLKAARATTSFYGGANNDTLSDSQVNDCEHARNRKTAGPATCCTASGGDDMLTGSRRAHG